MSYLNREVKQNPSQLAFKSQPHDVKIILFYLQNAKISRGIAPLFSATYAGRINFRDFTRVSQQRLLSRAQASSTSAPVPSRIHTCPFISIIRKSAKFAEQNILWALTKGIGNSLGFNTLLGFKESGLNGISSNAQRYPLRYVLNLSATGQARAPQEASLATCIWADKRGLLLWELAALPGFLSVPFSSLHISLPMFCNLALTTLFKM